MMKNQSWKTVAWTCHSSQQFPAVMIIRSLPGLFFGLTIEVKQLCLITETGNLELKMGHWGHTLRIDYCSLITHIWSICCTFSDVQLLFFFWGNHRTKELEQTSGIFWEVNSLGATSLFCHHKPRQVLTVCVPLFIPASHQLYPTLLN